MPDEIDELATLLAEGAVAEPASEVAPELPEPGAQGIESRVKGLQQVIGRKDAELQETRTALAAMQAQIEELRVSTMSEDERSQYARSKEASELVALRQRLAIYELQSEFPDEVPAYQKLISAKDVMEQLVVLRELRGGTPKKVEEPPTPDIDPNNPRRTQKGEILPDGSFMSDDVAERVLKAAPKGWFGRGR